MPGQGVPNLCDFRARCKVTRDSAILRGNSKDQRAAKRGRQKLLPLRLLNQLDNFNAARAGLVNSRQSPPKMALTFWRMAKGGGTKGGI